MRARYFGGTGAWDDPLRRLSRFDGAAFHPVEPGSITSPTVHVFIHGWQPGLRLLERMHAIGDVVPSLPAWDPRLVDPLGRSLHSYHAHLLEALTALGDDHCVLYYSWIDESATDLDVMLAYRSRQATQINGRRLAMALQQSLGSENVRLHLIGHSHGSAVAVHASAALARRPDQVTLLDAPENGVSRLSGAANLIDVVLPRIKPGRDDEHPFVDSYASVFGRPYRRKPGLSDVVDVSLYGGLAFKPTVVEAISGAHLYAVDWYALSVREAHRGVGFGWSPLQGADVKGLSSSYHSRRRKRPLVLRRRTDLPRMFGARRKVPMVTRPSRITGAEMHLSTRHTAAAQVLRILPGDGLIEFDVEMTGGDGSEQVHLDLDAVPVYVAQARFPVPRSGRYVVLADGAAGDHLFTARLVTDPNAKYDEDTDDAQPPRVSVTNVSIVSWPDAALGFTFERIAMTTFVTGTVAGALGTLFTQAGLRLARRGVRILVAVARSQR
ncbi:hypothetical protein LWF15_12185 [Kineosporia rhizophila]|uniref:hypothetical protein n=1 Tax=Kineosporia rhizophila TaxID=84633 RepID=UPI001E598A16|nr:hypothetical protein [Kineosporia rhizophila]MCE0536267.1 hypothetical protein [Kineosporia rhizophila]